MQAELDKTTKSSIHENTIYHKIPKMIPMNINEAKVSSIFICFHNMNLFAFI